MAPLPITLAARLLPTVVLAIVGWSMTTTGNSTADAGSRNSAVSPAPSSSSSGSGSGTGTNSGSGSGASYSTPPAACGSITAATLKKLVPDVKPAGKELKLTDPTHRTGCSWNALKGFDYRWLDVTFEVAAADNGTTGQSAEATARKTYAAQKKTSALTGLGDEASVSTSLTKESGQQTQEAVLVVRKGNALVTVTYNGSDFETKKAPSATDVRQGALSAAKEALTALGKASTVAS
ncbi:hypothetical protein ACFXJ5_03350 [Streptomyces sp. NPDC059373]